MDFRLLRLSHFPFLKPFLSTLDGFFLFYISYLRAATFGSRSWYSCHLLNHSSAFNHFCSNDITYCSIFILFNFSHIFSSSWQFFHFLLNKSDFFFKPERVKLCLTSRIFFTQSRKFHPHIQIFSFLKKKMEI